MKAIINRILENNLSELKGLSVEGEIPLNEDFLNEMIQLYLENNSFTNTQASSVSPPADTAIDFKRILNSLDKKEIKIELNEKTALLKISAKKY